MRRARRQELALARCGRPQARGAGPLTAFAAGHARPWLACESSAERTASPLWPAAGSRHGTAHCVRGGTRSPMARVRELGGKNRVAVVAGRRLAARDRSLRSRRDTLAHGSRARARRKEPPRRCGRPQARGTGPLTAFAAGHARLARVRELGGKNRLTVMASRRFAARDRSLRSRRDTLALARVRELGGKNRLAVVAGRRFAARDRSLRSRLDTLAWLACESSAERTASPLWPAARPVPQPSAARLSRSRRRRESSYTPLVACPR